MLAIAPLTRLEEETAASLSAALPKTLLLSYLTWAAIVVFTVGAGLLLWSVLRTRRAYVSERMTKKTAHYVLSFLPVGLAVLQLFDLNGSAATVFAAVSLLVALIGTGGLLLRRKPGLVFAVLGVWLSLPGKEAPRVAAIYADMKQLDAYNAASKTAIFATDRVILGTVTGLAFLAAVITLVYVVCYTRRRYLFRSAFACWFGELSSCPACGAPLVSEGDYCPACGEEIRELPRSVLRWEPLDEPRCCENCGHDLDKNGSCRSCDALGALQKRVDESARDEIMGKVKYVVACLLVALFVFLPLLRGETLQKLTAGILPVNDAFVSRCNEWMEDPALSQDEAWLKSFDEAANALYEMNARLFEAKAERMSYKELYGYIQYIEASYKQMAVIQRISAAVHEGRSPEEEDLGGYYNGTLRLQQQALASPLLLQVSTVNTAIHAVEDSSRYYFSFLPGAAVAVLFGVLGVLLTAAGVVLFLRRRDPSPLEREAYVGLSEQEKAVRKEKNRALRKSERTVALLGVGLALVILGVSFAVTFVKNAGAAPTVEERVHAVFNADAVTLTTWISNCSADPEKALADAPQIDAVLERSMEQLDAVLQDDEADADLKTLCEATFEAYGDLRGLIEKGALPDRETQKAVGELLLEGMKLDAEKLIENAFESLEDLF